MIRASALTGHYQTRPDQTRLLAGHIHLPTYMTRQEALQTQATPCREWLGWEVIQDLDGRMHGCYGGMDERPERPGR